MAQSIVCNGSKPLKSRNGTVLTLSSPGEADARNSKSDLDQRITRLLTSNTHLSARLRSLQSAVGTSRGSDNGNPPTYTPTSQPAMLLLARTSATSSLNSTSIPPRVLAPSRSRWSPFSGYMLADVPILSTIALPVTTMELRSGQSFHTFAFARIMAQDLNELLLSSHDGTRAAAYAHQSSRKSSGSLTSSTGCEMEKSGKERKWPKLGFVNTVKRLNKRKKKKQCIN